MPADPMQSGLPGDTPARPDRGQADDGKAGGAVHDGKPGATQFDNKRGAGVNAQSGKTSGTETEVNAPGISTDKKADDTK